jgi:hypothetical protein
MVQRVPGSSIAALMLLLSAGIANIMFWIIWGPAGHVGMLWALAVTAIAGFAALVSIRPGRRLFGSITAASVVLLFFNLVDAEAGGANEYMGVILGALLLPIILILAVAAFIRSSFGTESGLAKRIKRSRYGAS